MPALRSCYFCGDAAGTTLEECAVRGQDGNVTVTLCTTCRGKLDQLLGGIGAALARTDGERDGRAESTRDAGDDGAGRADGPDAAARDRGSRATDEDGIVIEPPRDGDAGGASAAGGTGSSGAGSTGGAGPAETASDDAGATAQVQADAREAAETASAVGGTSSRSGSSPDAGADGRSTGSGDVDDLDEPGATGSSAGGGASDQGGSSTGRGSSTGGASTGTGDDRSSGADGSGSSSPQGVSTGTYNRVVRLLQNREFPVDRTEFETLASNAYDVNPADCAAILDLLVEEERLVEREGQLHRPE